MQEVTKEKSLKLTPTISRDNYRDRYRQENN